MKVSIKGIFGSICLTAVATATIQSTSSMASTQGISAPPPLHIIGIQNVQPVGKPSNVVFGSIDFLNHDDGWVIGKMNANTEGAKPFLWKTTDGGATWLRMPLTDEAVGMENLKFYSPSVGVAISDVTQSAGNEAADNYVILRTTDGGESWKPVWRGKAPVASWMPAGQPVLFTTAHAGVITFSGLSLLSKNEGKSWDRIYFPWHGFAANDLTFTSVENGWVIGALPVPSEKTKANPDPQEVLVGRTIDGGSHWTISKAISPKVGNPVGSLSVSFVNDKDGWIFADNFGTMTGSLYRTVNAGRAWQLMNAKVTVGRIVPEHMSFVGPNTGWIPVNSGAAPIPGGLVVMTNGGKRVQEFGSNQGWSLNSVSLVSAQDGWATGVAPGFENQGYLLHTTNGGKTFTQVLPALVPTTAISFANSHTGYGYGLASDPFALLKSRNAGSTWQRIGDIPSQTQFLGLSFVNQAYGWVAFEAAYPSGIPKAAHPVHIWITHNGGQTWSKHVTYVTYPPYAGQNILQLHLFTHHQASLVAASYPSLVLASTMDGGNHWQSTVLQSPTGQSLLTFTSQTNAWLLNGGNQMPVTLNQVSRSRLIAVGTLPGMYWPAGITFSTRADGWLAATYDDVTGPRARLRMFHTTDGGQTWKRYDFPQTLSFDPVQGQAWTDMAMFGSNEIWVLTGSGLLRSLDGGNTWSWMTDSSHVSTR